MAYISLGEESNSDVSLINGWSARGAETVYCTSRKGRQALEIAELLKKYGFLGTRLYYRKKRQMCITNCIDSDS